MKCQVIDDTESQVADEAANAIRDVLWKDIALYFDVHVQGSLGLSAG